MKYFSQSASDIPANVGAVHLGLRSTNSEEGFAAYGPWCGLEAGRYFGGLYARVRSPKTDGVVARLDVTADQSSVTLAHRDLYWTDFFTETAGLLGERFELSETLKDVEVRLWVKGNASFDIERLVIFRTDLV